MIRSKTTKIIFLSFFILVPFLTFSITTVKGAEIQNPVVGADWLYVGLGDFIDGTPNPQEQNIIFSSGGEDLLSINNIGIIAQTEDQIVYMAEVEFGFELSAHTAVSVSNAFPYMNIHASYEKQFLCYSYRDWANHGPDSCYYANWEYVDLGQMILHDYTGKLPITVGIQPLQSTSGTITFNGISMQVPTYSFDVIQTEVADIRSGEIGKYANVFENVADSQEITVSYDVMCDDLPDTCQAVLNKLEEYNIGVDATAEPVNGPTLAQSKCSAGQGTFDNINPIENQYYTFNYPISLAPEMYEYIQTVVVRQLSLCYHDALLGPYITITYGPRKWDIPRTVGVYVQNYYEYINFIVKTNMYATVPITAELSESILADPYLELGDWVWDISIMGGEVVVPIQHTPTPLDFFADILNFIIIIIVVGIAMYVFIKVGVPYLSRKAKGK